MPHLIGASIGASELRATHHKEAPPTSMGAEQSSPASAVRPPASAPRYPPPPLTTPRVPEEEALTDVDDLASRESTGHGCDAAGGSSLSAMVWNWAGMRTPDASVTPLASPVASQNASMHNRSNFSPSNKLPRPPPIAVENHEALLDFLWNWGWGRKPDSAATTPVSSMTGSRAGSREPSTHGARLYFALKAGLHGIAGPSPKPSPATSLHGGSAFRVAFNGGKASPPTTRSASVHGGSLFAAAAGNSLFSSSGGASAAAPSRGETAHSAHGGKYFGPGGCLQKLRG